MNKIIFTKNKDMYRGNLLTFMMLLFFSSSMLGQLSVSLDTTSPTCPNFTNGIISTNVSGGTAPYLYLWNNGFSSNQLLGIGAGYYSVTVTDADGNTAEASTTLADPADIDIAISLNDVCSGNGNVTTTVSGGVAPLSYQWDSGQTVASPAGLSAGIRCVTVTDANGCAGVGCTTVYNALSLDVTATGLACFISCDASVTATVMGGTGPYSYIWNTGATDGILENVPGGQYFVTVTDGNGCVITGDAVVSTPAQLGISLDIENPICGSGGTGKVTATASGGIAPYLYFWSNNMSGNVLDNVAPGTYGLTIVDANGCSDTAMATVIEEGNIDINISATPTSDCGTMDGTASASASGGTPPYSFEWNNGSTNTSIAGLAPGTYSVTVIDAENCAATASVAVAGAPAITLTSMGFPIECGSQQLGSAVVMAFDGTPPYSYLWSTGSTNQVVDNIPAGTYTVTVTDAAGCSAIAAVMIEDQQLTVTVNTTNGSCDGADGTATAMVSGGTAPYTYAWDNGSTGASISGLATGSYSVTASDATGCTGLANFDITAPDDLSCSINVDTPISTANGSDGQATVITSGGTAPFNIVWSNGQTDATATGLVPGTYVATVTDANNCSTTCEVELTNPAKIGDRVWIDTNRDGCQDADEDGIFGVVVVLEGTDLNGNAVNESTETDSDGNYTFDGLPAGTYILSIQKPAGYSFTSQNSCGDETVDSDGDADTGFTNAITLNAGDCNLDIDFGIYDICDNITDPGEICCNQTLCAPGNDPAPINSLAPASGGSGAIEYLWMRTEVLGPFGAGSWEVIPGATGLSYDPGPIQTTTYFARCARRENCTNFLETNIVTITVEMPFTAEITGNNFFCVGDAGTYSTPPFSGVSYDWDFGSNATPSTSTDPTVDVVWTGVGGTTITLAVTDGNCTAYHELFVIVTNLPSACGGTSNLVANPNENGTVSLEWSSAYSDEDWTYVVQRSTDGTHFETIETLYSNEENEYYFMDENPTEGTNFYQLSIENGDGDFAISNIAMTEVKLMAEHFDVYPNPFNDYVNVKMRSDVEEDVIMNLVTPYGKVAQSFIIPAESMNQSIDLSAVGSGVYYVQFISGNQLKRVYKVFKH